MFVMRAGNPWYILVLRAGSPWYINGPKAASPKYKYIPRAASGIKLELGNSNDIPSDLESFPSLLNP